MRKVFALSWTACLLTIKCLSGFLVICVAVWFRWSPMSLMTWKYNISSGDSCVLSTYGWVASDHLSSDLISASACLVGRVRPQGVVSCICTSKRVVESAVAGWNFFLDDVSQLDELFQLAFGQLTANVVDPCQLLLQGLDCLQSSCRWLRSQFAFLSKRCPAAHHVRLKHWVAGKLTRALFTCDTGHSSGLLHNIFSAISIVFMKLEWLLALKPRTLVPLRTRWHIPSARASRDTA